MTFSFNPQVNVSLYLCDEHSAPSELFGLVEMILMLFFFSVLITDNSCTQYLRPVRLRKIRIVICAMIVCYFSFSTRINDINGNKTRNKTGIVHRELKGVNQQILNTVLTHIHYGETN